MIEKIRGSKILTAAVLLCTAAVTGCYFVMSQGSPDNKIFCAESAVSLAAGIIFAAGLRVSLAGEKRYAGIFICCCGALMPIVLNPYLSIGCREIPYMLQSVMYAKRMFTLFCPFLAAALLKKAAGFADRRKISFVWVVIFYYLVSFSAIALMQHAKVGQIRVQYNYSITWDAVETFYWAAAVNAVFFLFIAPMPKPVKRRRTVPAVLLNIIALSEVCGHSWHIRRILNNFAEQFERGGLICALRESEWLQYRFELLRNVIGGAYNVGAYETVGEGSNLRFIFIHWSDEPFVCAYLTYGRAAAIGMLILFALLIGVLFLMKYDNEDAERMGRMIKRSFAAMCCLSFLSQPFLPAEQLMMPLTGRGSTVIFMMVVYLALPRIFTDDIYLRRLLKSFGKTRRLTLDERHLRGIFG